MECCTVEGTNKKFSNAAPRYAKTFTRKGLDGPQRRILDDLQALGLKERSVLEIGCGVGGLLLSLIKAGATRALGVEIADGMVAKAQELAAELDVADKVRYLTSDFVSSHADVPSHDIVVMDKVLCCYANPAGLITLAAPKAETFFVVSYPRSSLVSKVIFKGMERMGTLMRWSFHPFYHEPAMLEAEIGRQGLEEIQSRRTSIWQIKVFRRADGTRAKIQ